MEKLLGESIITPLVKAIQNAKNVSVVSAYPSDLKKGCIALQVVHEGLLKIFVNTNGEITEHHLNDYHNLEDFLSYGVTIDMGIDDPDACVTRIGNMSLHKTLPVHESWEGRVVNKDGSVRWILPKNDWSEAEEAGWLDGTDDDGTDDGTNVMIWIPKYYAKYTTREGSNGKNLYEIRWSEYKMLGYQEEGGFYVAAYPMILDRTNNVGRSIFNTSVNFMGGNGVNQLRNAGLPVTGQQYYKHQLFARANNNGDIRWNSYLSPAHKTLTWAYVIEYKTLNSEKTFVEALDENGYHQGGLPGYVSNTVTSDGSWANCPVGSLNAYGMRSISKQVDCYDKDNTTIKKATYNSYRGVREPYAQIWKFCIDILRLNGKTYKCTDPSKFYSTAVTTIPEGYNQIQDLPNLTEGWITDIEFGGNGEFFPVAVGGASNKKFCDYSWWAVRAGVTAFLVGGDSDDGSSCGFFYSSARDAPSNSAASVGSRLCFIPQA